MLEQEHGSIQSAQLTTSDDAHDSMRRWYVMIHLNPEWISAMLERENSGELVDWRQKTVTPKRESFSYYVPYFDIREGIGLEVRNDFRHFVFIYGSEKRIGELLASDWNNNTRLRLYHYRGRNGEPVMIRERDLQRLQIAFRQKFIEYFTGAPIQEFRNYRVGSKVRIKLPYWENLDGEIRRIRVKSSVDSASLRVAFNIQGLEREVSFPDLHVGDIEFRDEQTRQLLCGKVIENFEKEVAILLGHRFAVNKKLGVDARRTYIAEKKRQDAPRLRHLLSFADIEIESDGDNKRFTALMFMSAVLLGDMEAVEKYKLQVEKWLVHSSLSTFTDAYLALALFVATRNPQLRTAVKLYRDRHPDCPPILSRFINKVRDLRTRKGVKATADMASVL